MVCTAMQINAETGQGDIVVGKNGIEYADFLQSAVLCCLFGTKEENDYWGNLFVKIPFSSETQKTLCETVLNKDENILRSAIISDISKLITYGFIDSIEEVYINRTGEKRIEILLYFNTYNGIVKVEI